MKQIELKVEVLPTTGSSNKLLKMLKLAIIEAYFEFFKREIMKVLRATIC